MQREKEIETGLPSKLAKRRFRTQLTDWHRHQNGRSLPWKSESDPYKIWLSEIILQQTRAEQGTPYYLRFTLAYPSVNDLATAPDDEVLRLWQGLGYYARCRNMLATARQIVAEYEGKFPCTYEGLLDLKGIGPYTAAAIASFAFGLPFAVVDGNVYRVLARYFGIALPTDGAAGKKAFQQLADEVLDHNDPGGFNQAMMDLGATICTPALPKCGECPLWGKCIAKRHGLINDLPLRAKKPTVRTRHFHYLFIQYDNHIWLRARTAKDIWRGLYEPMVIEANAVLNDSDLTKHPAFLPLRIKELVLFDSSSSQRLTHRLIESKFFSVQVKKKPSMPEDGLWVPLQNLKDYPLPKTLVTFFEKKGYF